MWFLTLGNKLYIAGVIVAGLVSVLGYVYFSAYSSGKDAVERENLESTIDQIKERNEINEDVNQSDVCDLARELGLSVCD